jgi:riboflavin synthase
MFTGIIEEVGAVSRKSGADLAIMAKDVLVDLHLGDSIAVNGVCLTVVALNDHDFVVQVSPETYSRSTLASIRPGDAVNLERAMLAGGRFGGHMVQGHVDGVGHVAGIQPQGEFALWRFKAPSEVSKYLVPKGSVTVDGISLTVVEPTGDTFGVAVIPATLSKTTLMSKRRGDAVNLEADIIGKHIYHYLKNASGGAGVTMDLLARQGFV